METDGQAKEILQVLRAIYQRHLACDFTIEVSEPAVVEFRVHKAMLAAFARKFKKLLEAAQLETDRFRVQAVDSVTMSQLIDYIYTGNLDVNAQNVVPVLAAASLLEMTQVVTICQNFLMSNIDGGQLLQEPTEHTTSTGDTNLVDKSFVRDALDSKEPLHAVLRDSELVKCTDDRVEVKQDMVRRRPKKRKRGKKSGKCKKRQQQSVDRKCRKGMVSKYENFKSVSDEEALLTSQENDEEQDPSRRRSRRDHQNSRAAMVDTSLSSSADHGCHQPKSENRCDLEKRCSQDVNGQRDDTLSEQHELVKNKVSTLLIPKLTFSDLKCSICHDVFIHYSAKVLHEKRHQRLKLRWLGMLQRRYMPLYIRQYFYEMSKSDPSVALEKTDDGIPKISCQTDLGSNHLVANSDRFLSSDGDHNGSEVGGNATSQAGDSDLAEADKYDLSQTNSCDVLQNGDCGTSQASEPNLLQCRVVSQVNDTGLLNQPVYDELHTPHSVTSNVLNQDVNSTQAYFDEENHCVSVSGRLPSADVNVKRENRSPLLSDNLDDKHAKSDIQEASTNARQTCGLDGNLNPTDGSIHSLDLNFKSVISSKSCHANKVVNGIKVEKTECSVNDVWIKCEFNEVKEPNSVIARAEKVWQIRQNTGLFKERLKAGDRFDFMLKCKCKLCGVELLYSLRLSHCLQRHGFKRKCKQCGITTLHPASSAYHRIRVHGARLRNKNSATRTCTQCGRQFIYAQVLEQHKINCHSITRDDGIASAVKSLVCRHCQCAFKYHKALLIHLPTHGLTQEEVQLELTAPAEVPLRPKINNHKPGQLKKCPVCTHLFRAMTTLRQHMNQVHGLPVTRAHIMHMKNMNVKKIQCQEDGCSYSTIMVYELERHMRTCHPSASYECHFCHYKTSLKKRMAKHIKLNHMAGKTCEMCGRQFHKHYHLKHHYYKAHNIIDPTLKLHKCPKEGCGYSSLTQYSLDIHMRKHSTEKPYKCSECGRMLKTEKNLEKHMNKIHRGIRPYICDQCGASYGEESELKTHMARHDEAKKYHCLYCDYTTQEKGNYQSHLWARHKVKLHQKQTVFECQKCDYTTDRKTRFTQHMASHNNIRNFKCPHCDKAFIAKNTMTSHIKWTHMDKSMACDYCNHKTSTLNMLREHVRMMHTHRDVKPYQCAYCDYRCRTSGNCRKHCMNKHKGQPIKWLKVCDKYPNNDRPVLSMEHVPKENGILRKDSRSRRIFSYEPEAELLPADIKQGPAGVQVLQQEVVTQPEVPSVQQGLPGISPVMVTGPEIQAQLQTVLTPILHDQHVQIVHQSHKPGQYQQQQLASQQQPQQESLQQQYLSPLIINPPSLQPVQQQQQQQQQHLLVMMQQHGLKN